MNAIELQYVAFLQNTLIGQREENEYSFCLTLPLSMSPFQKNSLHKVKQVWHEQRCFGLGWVSPFH